MAYAVAGDVLNDVAVELGLISERLAGPVESTDPLMVQLCQLLTKAGQDVLGERKWGQLRGLQSFFTVANQGSYDVGDVGEVDESTFFDVTGNEPLLGPLTAREWTRYAAGPVLSGPPYRWRLRGQQLDLLPVPKAAHQLRFEYQSRFWVQQAWDGAGDPNQQRVTDSRDILWFQERLMRAALKLAWREAKGLDSTAVRADYERALSAAAAADTTGGVLHAGRVPGVPVLSRLNSPDTGYGKV